MWRWKKRRIPPRNAPLECAQGLLQETLFVNNQHAVHGKQAIEQRVIGGEVQGRGTRGYFQQPAVFLDATNDMTVSRQEIFGPCVSIIPADGLEHAIAVANDTPFGLSAGICTGSLKAAREFVRRSRSGLVMVNVPTARSEERRVGK